jgi:hypothetical protein
MTLYAEQRRAFLAQNPFFATLLPEMPPSPPQVPGMSLGQLRRHVGAAADSNAALILVVGWGDGSVLRALANDPFCRQKEIHQLILAGEEDAFAASLLQPLVALLTDMHLKFVPLRTSPDIARYGIET